MTDRCIWTRSSYCGEGDACLYLAAGPGGAVRIAERAPGDGGPVMSVGAPAWGAFVAAARGEEGRSFSRTLMRCL
ncbi:DUF397 domain-containing protein [Streptomyces sp. NPDC089919]|uniref:DUF397 domain-containing protein n=1 Tax=Streptomyces sp. NPDC089919 TaxID=3155188 RepID=UPI00343A6042